MTPFYTLPLSSLPDPDEPQPGDREALLKEFEDAAFVERFVDTAFAVSPRRGGGMIATDMNQVHEEAIRAKLIEMGWQPPDIGIPISTHKLNSDRTVAVATDYFWNEDMTTCPTGAKVQLLGAGGVASYGTYNGRDPFWVAWAPVPKRRPSSKN